MGYSARVELFFRSCGNRYCLKQVGPNHAVLVEPQEVPFGSAQVSVVVDGSEHVSDVVVVGSDPETGMVEFAI